MSHDDPYVNTENQLHLEMLGIGDVLNPYAGFDSGARKVMTGKFACQHLSLLHAEPRRTYTGVEAQLAEEDVGVSLPKDGAVLKIIDKYNLAISKFNIAENPSSFVIWEHVGEVNGKSVRIIDLLKVDSFYEGHASLGFKFKKKQIPIKTMLKAGTKLTTIPTITPEGQYCYGVNANIAFMSDPAVTEDGVVISESLQKKMSTILTGTRTASWGKQYYPLNVYGDRDTYKPFPDIGEKIHKSGIVMVLREYDPIFDVVNMTDDMLNFDGIIYDTDKVIWGKADSTVYDITVTKYPKTDFSRIPPAMTEQTDYYSDQMLRMYQDVLDTYHELKRNRGESFVLGYEFNRVIRDAIAHLTSDAVIKGYDGHSNKSCKFTMGPGQMDEITVNIKYASVVLPGKAFKLTSCHGGKAVICSVRPDHKMPVDASGRRADMVMDDASVLARMIPGVLYEQLFNACGDDTTKMIRKYAQENKHDEAWDLLCKYYETIAPISYKSATELYTTPEGKKEHIASVVKSGVYPCIPPNSSSLRYETIGKIMETLPLTYGPVEYITVVGEKVTTKKPVLIGSIYIMLLEKIGDTWSSVADAKLQHHGLLSKVPPASRYLSPAKQGAVRLSGESETRLFLKAIGPRATAELHDRSNSPETHKEVCTNIIAAKHPSKINKAVNRNIVPMGGHRGLTVIEHLLHCAGFKFEINDKYYTDETNKS